MHLAPHCDRIKRPKCLGDKPQEQLNALCQWEYQESYPNTEKALRLFLTMPISIKII